MKEIMMMKEEIVADVRACRCNGNLRQLQQAVTWIT